MSGTDCALIQAEAERLIASAGSSSALEALRVQYLGRKGVLAQLTGTLPSIPKEERAPFGQAVNALKSRLNELFAQRQKELDAPAGDVAAVAAQAGLPGIVSAAGGLHPLTRAVDDICGVFRRMGFTVEEGPEIETEYNNFTGLNIPLEHPSRDAFDTFYLDPSSAKERLLLRSHTSPGQVRVMKKRAPPLAVVVPGRVYRPDAVDASHLFMFHQIEGFVVAEGIRFSDLKGTLETFAKCVFGNDIRMRLRPHFFPFTEPSAEVDISCIMCKGKGCSVCGRKGWLEILGCGMIHPNVLRNVGYDPEKISGFAFGMGVERIVMLQYGIDDIRLFCENDLRFLRQF